MVIFKQDREKEVVENEVKLVPELLKAIGMSEETCKNSLIKKDLGKYT